MTRTIKFKCWNVEEKIMHDVAFPSWNGSIQVWKDNIAQSEVQYLSNGPEMQGILLQSTGLLDENGKEIFDGDILISKDRTDEAPYYMKPAPYEVNFESIIHDKMEGTFTSSSEKIIGNIYENSELIKK